MQKVLRPYVTSSIALVGAGLIVVTPVTPLSVAVPVTRAVELSATSWTDLFNDTLTNINNISSNADWGDIFKLVGEFFTNPTGVLAAITDLTPDITTGGTSLPLSIGVDLPPGLALGLSGLGAAITTDNAIHQAVTAMGGGGFGALFNELPGILNAYLNGTDSLSLLNGIVDLPALNGILAPIQSGGGIDLDLTKLLDVLGVGDTSVADLLNKLGLGDLGNLLQQLTSLNLNLGDLFHDLGLDDKGLGDLLDNPTLNQLLSDLGLGGLQLPSLDLGGLLSGLGLDNGLDLNNLPLSDILQAFHLGSLSLTGSLSSLLSGLGLTSFLDTSLGSLLNTLPGGLLTTVVGFLNNTISGLLSNLATSLPVLGPLLPQILNGLTLTPTDVIDALNNVTVGNLLDGQGLTGTLSSLLDALGLSDATGSGLSVAGVLEALGFPSSVGGLTLGGLLNDLGGGIGGLHLGDLLNNLNLGDLLNNLGLDKLPVNLGDLLHGIDLSKLLDSLGNLDNLTLSGLLNDLGVGDLAQIDVGQFGGFYTELFDTIPQQLLADIGA